MKKRQEYKLNLERCKRNAGYKENNEGKKIAREYAIKRDKALNTSFAAFKLFIYTNEFIPKESIPCDEALEMAFHKMRIESKGVYPINKKRSKEWLISHGCYVGINPDLDGN